MSRSIAPEADVEGAPSLTLRDDDREPLEDQLAELLIAALEREGEAP